MKIMADINVTPMADVMLVLLVIFMVTAPLLVAGVPVQLPKNSAQRLSQPNKPVIVTLAADRRLYIRDGQVGAASLIPRLLAMRGGEGDAVVYVRADKTISYGEVMELLGRLSSSGVPAHFTLVPAAPAKCRGGTPQAASVPRQDRTMNWVRAGAASAAFGIHVAIFGLFVVASLSDLDNAALQAGDGKDDLTVADTITMVSDGEVLVLTPPRHHGRKPRWRPSRPAGQGRGREGRGENQAST